MKLKWIRDKMKIKWIQMQRRRGMLCVSTDSDSHVLTIPSAVFELLVMWLTVLWSLLSLPPLMFQLMGILWGRYTKLLWNCKINLWICPNSNFISGTAHNLRFLDQDSWRFLQAKYLNKHEALKFNHVRERSEV